MTVVCSVTQCHILMDIQMHGYASYLSITHDNAGWYAIINDLSSLVAHLCHNRNTLIAHDEVINWKHILRYWPSRYSPVTGEFPAQRPVTRSFDVFFDLRLAWINSWVNNREAGDLRRHRAHYDVIVLNCVMYLEICTSLCYCMVVLYLTHF